MSDSKKLRLIPAQPGQRIARLVPYYEDGEGYQVSGGSERPTGVIAEFDLVVAWAFMPDIDEQIEPHPVTLIGIDWGRYAIWLWDDVWQNPEGRACTLDDCIAYALEVAQEAFDREQAKNASVDAAGDGFAVRLP